MDIEGYFWLPGKQDGRVGGRLTFDADGGTLSILGSLELHGNGRVLGVAGDGYYTLEECFVRRDNIIGPVTTQKIHVGRVLGGAAYDEDEEPVFDRVDFGLAGLTEWVGPPGVDEDINFGAAADGCGYPYTLTLGTWEPQIAALGAGTLTLHQSRGVKGDGLRERTLTQAMLFSWELGQELSLADAVDLASDIQDLVSIGTDRTASFDYLHLYHKSLSHNGFPHAIRLITSWLAKEDTGQQIPHPAQMVFTFDGIGGMDGISKWHDTACRYRSMLDHVMNTRYVKMFADVKLIFRIAALHGMHTAWKSPAKERNLNAALTQLADVAGDPFSQLVPDPAAWIQKVTSERNNLAHHYQRRHHQDSTDLYYSSEAAYWLFVLCMMRMAEFPQTAFEQLVRCPQYGWLRGQLAAI